MDRSPSHFYLVDLVRFCCALAVLSFHYAMLFPLEPDSFLHAFGEVPPLSAEWAGATWFGWVGVDIFFVLSGYVIALSATEGGQAGFVRRRVLRLAPAAWICATLTAIVLLADASFPPETVLTRWSAAIVFYPLVRPIDPSYWTLSVEACFYLMVALMVRDSGRAVQRIERFGIVLGMASAGFWIVMIATHHPLGSPARILALNLTLLPHGLLFSLGILIWVAARRGWTPPRIVGAAALIAVITAKHHEAASGAQVANGVIGNFAMLNLVFGAAIAVLIAAPHAQRRLSRLPGIEHLRTLGLMTYPLYLVHQVIGAACLSMMLRWHVTSGRAIIGTALAMIALAYAITRWIEPAVRASLRSIMRRGPAPDSRSSAFPRAG